MRKFVVRIGPRGQRVGPQVPPDWERMRSGGPRPFTSWVAYRLPDQSSYVWESRHHRKGSGPRMSYADRVGLRATSAGEDGSARSPWMRFWAPHRLAWWIAVVFMVGSVFFAVGAAGSLMPEAFVGEHGMSVFAESCYFTGAVQKLRTQAITLVRLRIRRLDFFDPVCAAARLAGIQLRDHVRAGLDRGIMPELGLWWTSLIGAGFFLVAGFLQYIEADHDYLSFVPRDVSWWIGVLFILGSLGFVVGALPGLGTPGLPTAEQGAGAAIVKLGFLVGGLAFLLGSYLMLPELFTRLRARGRTSEECLA